jgi:hypothetical protein
LFKRWPDLADARPPEQTGASVNINDNYVTTAPSAQNALDLFADSWTCRLPDEALVSGTVEAFQDRRIEWLVYNRGRFDGQSILELGPLEAGHSWMLEQAGAASILAIEANTRAYLRCLIVKEVLGMRRTRFALGDFDRYFEVSQDRFDFILASGVLYHLVDPLMTLQHMMARTDELLIWSHFFDEAAMPEGDPRRAAFTGETRLRESNGDALTYHIRSYGGATGGDNFTGGIASGSIWVPKGEAIALLEKHGFKVTPFVEHDDHPFGPAACLYAKR